MSSLWSFYDVDGSNAPLKRSVSLDEMNGLRSRTIAHQAISHFITLLQRFAYSLQCIFLLVTAWNWPFFLRRVWRFRRLIRTVKAAHIKQEYNHNGTQISSSCSLASLPNEVVAILLLHLDPTSLCRFGATASQWHSWSRDPMLWQIKFFNDWAVTRLKSNLKKETRKRNLDYLSLYRIRYEAAKNTCESLSQRDLRRGFWSGLLQDEFWSGVSRTFHITMVPFKVLGLISWPLHKLWFSTMEYPNTPSLACLRCKSCSQFPRSNA